MKLDAQHWPVWSNFIAAPADPIEYNEAAVGRLMEAISPYVVDVKNVRPQFKAINRVRMIDFENPQDKERYNTAYLRYIEACAKTRQNSGEGSAFAQLVEWLKFRQEAELIRAPYIAGQLHHAVTEGLAAVSACNFKATIAKIALVLNQRYQVPREKISIIWGGSAQYAAKDTFSLEEIQRMLAAIMAGQQVDPGKLTKAKHQLLAMNAGLGDIPPELDLGPQDYEKRQTEIDRFQSGSSLYCLFNFKSGGVGLSLHHSDSLTEQKVRRKKESAYAYEEDIPLIPVRPRVSYLAPTYSAIELVQGLGRVPRITSLSDTVQTLVFYRGTIEAAVAAIVSQKLRCLKQVVRQRETWEDVIIGQQKSGGQHAAIPAAVPDEDSVDGSELFDLDSDGGDDEDDE